MDRFTEFVSVGGKTADFLSVGDDADGRYRGDVVNFFPKNREPGSECDVQNIYEHVLKGWEPGEPFIDKDDLITAFGSCFAAHVEAHLRSRGYKTSISEYGNPESSNYWGKSLIIKCGEGFVNTFSLRTQFEWIFTDAMPEIRIWHKSDGHIREYIDANKAASERIFNETAVFILTLGLSELWYDKTTGAVLWTAVPRKQFDPDVFGFRIASTQENLANLTRVVELIRAYRGDVPIVFTLSPVALNATFRPISCITANSASKARLRVAVDDLMLSRPNDKHLFYFPSYEMVTAYLQQPWLPDQLHPSAETIQKIVSVFERYYCRTEAAPDT